LTAKVAGIAAVARRVGTSSDTLSIRGPEDLAAASQTAPTVTVVTVTVVTKADIETDGYPVSVLPINVLGWNQATTPAADTQAKLAVNGLPKPCGGRRCGLLGLVVQI
jgi:hypothetical protein